MKYIVSQSQGKNKFTLYAFLNNENKHWIDENEDINELGYAVAKDAYYLIPQLAEEQEHDYQKDLYIFPIGATENILETCNRTHTYIPATNNGFNERQLYVFRAECTGELYYLDEIEVPYFLSVFGDMARRRLIRQSSSSYFE